MASCSCFRLLISALLITFLAIYSSSSSAAGDHGGFGRQLELEWMAAKVGGEKQRCRGSMGECMAGLEFEMDTEINRRILATSNYISYGALQRNTVPCSQRGASYYNCRPGAQANPYNRGCSAITRCRS